MLKARVSSAIKSVDLKQEVGPLIIGERLNTQGSKKAKELVLGDDFDGLVDLARTQVEDCLLYTSPSPRDKMVLIVLMFVLQQQNAQMKKSFS